MGSDQKNALIAIVLSGAILFGWQYFFSPQVNPTAETATSPTSVSIPETAPLSTTGPIGPAKSEGFALANSGFSIEGLTSIALSNMRTEQARFDFAEIVGSQAPFFLEVAPGGQKFSPVNLVKTGGDERSWQGEDPVLGIRAVFALTENNMLSVKVMAETPFKYRYNFQTEAKKLENGQERQFSFYDDSLRHWSVGSEEIKDATVSWAGIDFNYHLFALSFETPAALALRTLKDNRFQLYSNTPVSELGFDLIFVKKEYNYLSSLGRHLKHAVDFGFWGFFAELILKGLQFFYSVLPNYGMAIIFITFLVRLLTFPLQYKSFVSMKKMQLIQPELTKIREKFKDDPMRLQKESMDLFKRSGANPLGGCLPMILQLPVFFAFYKVLYSAVELVDAPFIGWINDLSNKDPYFVLPLLMAGAMFLQQKLTPTTVTDPVQKKVFMFMPIIFGFIMKDLPSGLSLYIFVSTLMGIGQQLLVFKITGNKPQVV